MIQESSTPNNAAHATEARPQSRTLPPFWIALLVVCVIDQIAKWLAVSFLPKPWPIIGAWIPNRGVAFGLFSEVPRLTIPFSMLVTLGALVYYLRVRGKDRWLDVALGLLVGGALSNLADRLRLGYVIDFIDFRIWPVFNLADASITVAVALIVWRAFKDEEGEPPRP